MRTLVLIDCNNLVYKSGYVHRFLKTKAGTPSGLAFGLLRTLLGINTHCPNANYVFVWDNPSGGQPGQPATWRHLLAPGVYKANRVGERPPEIQQAIRQIPAMHEFLKIMGFKSITISKFEADDVIGFISTQVVNYRAMDKAVIFSSDKDFFQLVSDKIVVLRDTSKEAEWITSDAVYAEFGVTPEQWCLMRALAGDKSDDIPQVRRGIGPKTAANLVQEGLNPSLITFDRHPESVKRAYRDWEVDWPKVWLNYKLTRIATVENYMRLGLSQEDLKSLNALQIFCKDFTRKKFEDGFERLEEYMLKYELNDLWQRRQELWQLR